MDIAQALPVLAYLYVVWAYRNSLKRALRASPRPVDIVKLPIFFNALSIAYNIAWVTLSGALRYHDDPVVIAGRLLGIVIHLGVAGGFIYAHRQLLSAQSDG